MTACDVSVIVPTWNRSELVSDALRSVLRQSSPPREVILVDDGSTDDTGRRIPREFPQVRYLYQPNRGVSAARNRGIALAESEWLAFLDSDDQWLPRKLERQLAALAEAPHHLLCHTDEIWIRRGRRVNPMHKHRKRGGFIFEHCLPRCAISPSSVVIHRRLFEELGAFDESLPACEDYDLWLRITARHSVLFVDEPLVVKYGGRPDQLSRRHWGMDRFRIQALEKILATEGLPGETYRAARATLSQKIRIYLTGAEKRGREEECARYREKLSACSSEPASREGETAL